MNESLVVSSIAASRSRPRVGSYRISPMRRVRLRDRLAFGFASLGLLDPGAPCGSRRGRDGRRRSQAGPEGQPGAGKPKDATLTPVMSRPRPGPATP